jgi:hypothetical protein
VLAASRRRLQPRLRTCCPAGRRAAAPPASVSCLCLPPLSSGCRVAALAAPWIYTTERSTPRDRTCAGLACSPSAYARRVRTHAARSASACLACSPSAYARRMRTHAARSTSTGPLLLRALAAHHRAMVRLDRPRARCRCTLATLVPSSASCARRSRMDRIRRPRVLAALARMSCSTPTGRLFSLRASRLGSCHRYAHA